MHELMSDPASSVREASRRTSQIEISTTRSRDAYNRYVDVRMGVEDASEAITESPFWR